MQIEKKNNYDKKINNEKIINDNISNIKFINITNLKSFVYVNMFINKIINNFLWKSVIYDFNCNNSFIYNLN
jgi:hypothetical protein